MGVMLPKIETTSSPAQQMLKDMDDQLVDLKEHLSTALNRMKLLANKKWIDRVFQVGDQVLLKLQPYMHNL